MTKYDASFSVSVLGDVTQEQFKGVFKVKTRFSHRDTLTKDQLYREHIGQQPGEPSPYAKDLATVFSELGVRVTEAPSWWTASDNGIDLEDGNVVVDVYTQALAAEKTAKEALKAKATEAATELKKE